MSIQYLVKNKEYIPILLKENNIVEFDMGYNEWAALSDRDDQFVFRKIMDDECFYKHGHNNRLKKYTFGKGLIKFNGKTFPYVIFCEDNKVVVDKHWDVYYPADFGRFKKMLKENGYNTRKDIIYMSSTEMEEFFYDPFAPTFQDHQPEYQKELSRAFMLEERAKIITAPIEEDINDEDVFDPELIQEILYN